MSTQKFIQTVSEIAVENLAGPYQGKLIPSITVVDTYAARRVSDGLEALMLVVVYESISIIHEWPSSVGFSVEVIPEDPGSPKSKMQIFLQLTEERFRDVFFALCEDVCTVLADAVEELEAVRVFHSRLMRWQSFLKKGKFEGLSEEKQVGLYGELIIMKDVLLPAFISSDVLKAWRGCKKANQDYQFPDWALEVKTSRATIIEKVSISNVQQLDEDGKAPLILTVVHVHSNMTSGSTLPEIVSQLRNTLDGEASDLFEEGLFEVEYLDIHVPLYQDTKYQVLDVNHYEVSEGFPRLRKSDLPDGVKRVKYDISIDSTREYKVSEDVLYKIGERSVDANND